MKITHAQIIDWLKIFADKIEASKDYLTELDAAIGDADHGINMARGMARLREGVIAAPGSDIGMDLKKVAMSLMATVGGASGPLYGSFFMQASVACAGKKELIVEEILAALQAGANGIQKRGRANPDDKTMYDVWHKALPVFERALANDNGVAALEKFAAAAQAAAEETVALIAKKGRASYLGERSKGHKDPGSASTCYLIEALKEAVAK